jgi:Fe-S cluster assembly iron-binding protein IscA
LAPGEPQDGEVTVEKDGMTFSVDREIAEVVNFMEIEYYKFGFRKGFEVYVNGSRRSC